MSGFSSIALPGGIPVCGGGRNDVTPDKLFKNTSEREAYRDLLYHQKSPSLSPEVSVKRVKVEIFDLSDSKQLKRYEKLWASLLKKAELGRVIIEARKDLVNRADGTSYWMKYVEYVEYGSEHENAGSNSTDKDEKRGKK